MSLDKANIEDVYPMSDIEKGMAYYSLRDAQTSVYHNQMISRQTDRAFNPGILKKAMELLVEKHPILRTGFSMDGFKEPVQVVFKKISSDIEHYDISGMTKRQQQEYVKAFLAEDRKKSFNINEPSPLWRLRTFCTGKGNLYFVWICHHAMSDGWSSASLLTELHNTYWRLKSDPGFVPKKLKNTYKQFVMEELLEKKENKTIDFWKKELAGYKRLELPGPVKARGESKCPGTRKLERRLNLRLLEQLTATARRHHTTVKNLCFAAYIYMLNMLSYENDIVTGLVTHNRPECEDGDKIIGCFLNEIPVRIKIPIDIQWVDYIHLVDKKLLELVSFSRLSFFEIVRIIGEETRDENPIFDSIFNFVDFHVYGGMVKRDITENEHKQGDEEEPAQEQDIVDPGISDEGLLMSTNTWLDFNVDLTSGVFLLTIDYNNAALEDSRVDSLCGYFEAILNKMVREPERIARKEEIMAVSERQALLFEFNDTAAEYPAETTVYERFQQQVEKVPTQIGVRCGQSVKTGVKASAMTYRQLNHRANQLARLLRTKGIKPSKVVGIMVERSLEMVIGIMAILKAGGAYLPIDADYPAQRVISMLENSNSALLLTTGQTALKSSLSSISGQQEILPLDGDDEAKLLDIESGENLSPLSGPGDLIYIIFTSGSTGVPKGAGVYHRGFMNLMHWFVNDFGLDASDSNLFLTSLSFDLTQKNLYASLITGGLLCIPGIKHFDPLILLQQIRDNRISWINCTPSMFYQLVTPELESRQKKLSSLRYVFLGGEPISMAVLLQWLESDSCHAQVVNTYGPTECTDICASYRIREPRRFLEEIIPLGGPIYNVRLYIVDKGLRLLPVGVIGELCIAGAGVGSGYCDDKQLTGKKFKRHCFGVGAPETLLYRSGDLVRRLPDSMIEFVGRIDHQVKVRGFRIELGEIENRLLNHEEIKEAAVMPRKQENDDIILCAYIVLNSCSSPSPGSTHTGDITRFKAYLAETLPAYMIPSHFVLLERMPLNPNGKIDRNALPAPEMSVQRVNEYAAPRDEIEKKLVEIWSEVLNISINQNQQKAPHLSIGIDDNFFELGGHSLSAVSLASKIHKKFDVKLPLADIFENPNIKGLACCIRSSKRDLFRDIELVEKKEYYPLSSVQKRLYFLKEMEPESTAYNMFQAVVLQGKLMADRLGWVFQKLLTRHESFRTSIEMIEAEPVQRIHHEDYKLHITNYNTSGTPGPLTIQNTQSQIKNENFPIDDIIKSFIRPFDLARAPLLRVGLIRTGKDNHIMMVDMHHIISDGTSVAILVKEFISLYAGEELTPLKIHYKDFSRWQNSQKQKENLKKQEEYWVKHLEGEMEVLDLPIDYERTAIKSFNGGNINFTLVNRDSRALKELALKEETTLYMVLLSLYNILLAKLGDQDKVFVGTVTAGRRHWELQQVMGMFVNTLVLKHFPHGEKTFLEFLEEVKKNTINAFENQDYPFEDLVEKLVTNRNPSRNPIFDVMFQLEETSPLQLTVRGLALNFYESENKTSKFDMNWICIDADSDKDLLFTVEYCTDLFKAKTIASFITYFKAIIRSVLEDPQKKISGIEIISPQEKKHLLLDFNHTGDTGVEYLPGQTLVSIFAEQVEKTPDRTALVYENQHISYGELNDRINGWAQLIRQKGVKRGSIVGLMVPRSVEVVMGILGILKAGGAYLPIETNYPRDRIRFILEDSVTRMVLTTKSLAKDMISDFKGKLFYVDGEEGREYEREYEVASHIHWRPDAADLAYVIYTSGTTGKPKGVMIEHREVVNYIWWARKTYVKEENLNFPLFTSISFDLTVTSLFTPLVSGNAVVVYGGSDKEFLIGKIIDENKVGVVKITPSHLKLIRDKALRGVKSSIKRFIVGGEELESQLARDIWFNFNEEVEIFNEYGPTETVVGCVIHRFDPQKDHWNSVPIGLPMDNTESYVWDGNGKFVPVGVKGELFIGGAGVGRGYLNRPELTAEKFIENPYRPGEVVYRTGDLVKYRNNGNKIVLDYLGRKDRQVKIRGYRIETGEIEAALLKHREIKAVAVTARDVPVGSGGELEKYLCAYVVSEKKLENEEIRDYLSADLSQYMIPSFFIPIEKIPLTPNGKINWNALPVPEIKGDENGEPPANEVERILAEVWGDVLGIKPIGVHDNYFLMGGDSINTIRIASRLSQYQLKFEIKDLFLHPTIRQLGKCLKKTDVVVDQGVVEGEVKLSPIQEWFFQEHDTDIHHFNHAVMLGAHPGERFEEAAVNAVFLKLQEHHDGLRMVYKKLNGHYKQINQGLPPALSLQVYDFRSKPGKAETIKAIEAAVNDIQASIHLENGPLIKLGLFHLDDEDRLLIVCHHLVIDGISWRIILEDIETLFQQYKKGEPLALPSKTHSCKEWSAKLHEYANSNEFLKEKNYWTRLDSRETPQIRRDFEEEKNVVKDTQQLSFSLNRENSERLLSKVNNAFGTEINDILVAALSLGIKKTFGIDRVSLAMEGHGREEIPAGVDITRTIGWFTSIYPVSITTSYEDDLARHIKEIKENLHQVPHHGIGYGILRYLTLEENKQDMDFNTRPQIIFNYLGQVDSDVNSKSFKISQEPTGQSMGPNLERYYWLEISGIIVNKKLAMSITYNKKQFKPMTIKQLWDHYHLELNRIISYCSIQEERALTPSDFTYKDLSIEEVDGLTSEYSVQDIYPSTPMQGGLYFETVYDNSALSVFEQFSYHLRGALNIVFVKKALAELFKRYDILRTVFIQIKNKVFQVVLNEISMDFYYEDIARKKDKQEYMTRFKEIDTNNSFDLNKGPLMRLAVFQLDRTEYEFVWSFHHILMDGWCIGILISEFLEIYTAYLKQVPLHLPAVKPFRTYIQWLEKRDKKEAQNYWRQYLAGYEENIGISGLKWQETSDEEYKTEEVVLALDRQKSIQLGELASRNNVTLNTVIQVIWSIVLGKYNSRQDVVFGTVVSGRPSEITGVESMVGLFINTIPVRIKYTDQITFLQLVQEVQRTAVASEPYHYYPLVEIQGSHSLKGDLIDHLMVFENYPIDEQLTELVNANSDTQHGIQLIKFSHGELQHSSYDFNIAVKPLKQLIIIFGFNANLYRSQVVERIANQTDNVVEQILCDNCIKVGDISIQHGLVEVNSNTFREEYGDFEF
ncbi:MAG: amino acid adenylation domain-containing protein [Candidatus Aminicenantes bacterium]